MRGFVFLTSVFVMVMLGCLAVLPAEATAAGTCRGGNCPLAVVPAPVSQAAEVAKPVARPDAVQAVTVDAYAEVRKSCTARCDSTPGRRPILRAATTPIHAAGTAIRGVGRGLGVVFSCRR